MQKVTKMAAMIVAVVVVSCSSSVDDGSGALEDEIVESQQVDDAGKEVEPDAGADGDTDTDTDAGADDNSCDVLTDERCNGDIVELCFDYHWGAKEDCGATGLECYESDDYGIGCVEDAQACDDVVCEEIPETYCQDDRFIVEWVGSNTCDITTGECDLQEEVSWCEVACAEQEGDDECAPNLCGDVVCDLPELDGECQINESGWEYVMTKRQSGEGGCDSLTGECFYNQTVFKFCIGECIEQDGDDVCAPDMLGELCVDNSDCGNNAEYCVPSPFGEDNFCSSTGCTDQGDCPSGYMCFNCMHSDFFSSQRFCGPEEWEDIGFIESECDNVN